MVLRERDRNRDLYPNCDVTASVSIECAFLHEIHI